MLRKTPGFTIVELLIAIVVIAILAAVTVFAYSGITKRTHTSNLKHDVQAMDVAQKRYMAQENSTPLSYNGDGSLNDTLTFVATKGNSIIVHLKNDSQYCIYGYNPDSNYPSAQQAYVASSDNTTCAPLSGNPGVEPGGAFSTVTIVGQQLEQYFNHHGAYPTLSALVDIGLIIKPNSGNANQQQLYCRNNTKAIYLQVEKSDDVIYVYVTASHSVTQPIIDGKLPLSTICAQYDIKATDPGFESTGIKNPDF